LNVDARPFKGPTPQRGKALIGIDLRQSRSYAISVDATVAGQGRARQESNVVVAAKQFPTRTLKVDEAFVIRRRA